MILKISLILNLVFLAAFFVSYLVTKHYKRENQELKKYEEKYYAEKNASEEKSKLHTGDSVSDFNNSISVLQKFSSRK